MLLQTYELMFNISCNVPLSKGNENLVCLGTPAMTAEVQMVSRIYPSSNIYINKTISLFKDV